MSTTYLVTPRRVLGSDSERFTAHDDKEAARIARKLMALDNVLAYELYRLIEQTED